jgi:Zinc finger, C3HC4 type (RING finger)
MVARGDFVRFRFNSFSSDAAWGRVVYADASQATINVAMAPDQSLPSHARVRVRYIIMAENESRLIPPLGQSTSKVLSRTNADHTGPIRAVDEEMARRASLVGRLAAGRARARAARSAAAMRVRVDAPFGAVAAGMPGRAAADGPGRAGAAAGGPARAGALVPRDFVFRDPVVELRGEEFEDMARAIAESAMHAAASMGQAAAAMGRARAAVGEAASLFPRDPPSLQPPKSSNERASGALPPCVICMDAPIDCVLVPCGHTACHACGTRLHVCHVCRAHVHGRQRLFA